LPPTTISKSTTAPSKKARSTNPWWTWARWSTPGIDYEKILRQAEAGADVIVWDGGNNDTPFFKPDIGVVVFDPHRAGHETRYHPGETNMLMADIAVINKVDSASAGDVARVRRAPSPKHNPGPPSFWPTRSSVTTIPPRAWGKRVLVVEDGPTLTHGEMTYGAGTIAAANSSPPRLVDPRPWLEGSLQQTFDQYPHIGALLPAMGYGGQQMKELEAPSMHVDCDLVVFATPIDLTRLLSIDKPALRVRYDYKDHGEPTLKGLIQSMLGI
jgi:predicted GTPase